MDGTVRFRETTAGDAASIAAIYALYMRDTIISFETEPPAAAEMSRRIASVGERYPWLLAEQGGQVLGYAYAGEHRSRAAYRWDVDVAVYLAAAAHRRGIGRRLYQVLFDMLRLQGYINAYAGISLPNAASVGLHESLGFLAVGEAMYLRYHVMENSTVSLACQGGLHTWLCDTFQVATVLYRHGVFGGVALVVALLNLLRPSLVLVAVALAAAACGVVLHNADYSALAAGVLILSLARPVPKTA